MSDPFDFDLEKFRVTEEDIARIRLERERKQPPTQNELHRWPEAKGFKFHKVPRGLLEDIAERTNCIPLIILCVLSRLWFKNSCHNPVTLTSRILKELGISRHQKRRALKFLEETGHIIVKRCHGKNPKITLKWQPH
jgi:hypothetical protein